MEKKIIKLSKPDKRKHEAKEPVAPQPESPSSEAARLRFAEEENERLKKEIEEMKKAKAQEKIDSGKIPPGILKKVNFMRKICGKLPEQENFLASLNPKAATYKDLSDVVKVQKTLMMQLLEEWPEVKKYPIYKEPKDKEKKAKKVKVVVEEDEVPANQEEALANSNFFLDD